ncbi:MAG: acyltransferase domain-containing protein, partial [Anaerolineales bacterium]
MTRKTATQKPQHSGLEKPVQKEPIAIIGIGCRFPGGANSPEQLWALLRDGTHVVSEIPSSRIDLETYFDPRPATPGKMMTRWGGFLEDIDRFDASFFGIAPREAARLDPQQRLLLEVAWEAIEDAGQLPDQLKSSLTGVYIGLWINDFESRLFVDPSLIDFYMTTGSGRYSASGRVSYFLGLQGPSITVDTACSSSLVAVHLACQSLWSGESSLAMAGGANVILQPHISIAYSRSKMMAADGRCKFGDAEADGYVRSEGAALVVLKRLSQAIQDGDSIYAVIRGGAVNNDGQSSGFLATPGQQGQEEMLRLAYRNAGVNPHDVQYVEAHGTGTRVGDPIELGAIGNILGAGRSAESPIRVGSIKTNFGHTEGAAGIAGLIKVALSLKNGAIPPSLHLNTVNPNIPWKELNINIPTALTPWPAGQEKIAGVSAFGIAGTNAHIVLAEAPPTPRKTISQNTAETYVLPLSAQSPAALRSLAESYVTFLNKENVPALQDIGYTISHHRTHHAERLTVAGKSHQELADQLSAYLQQASSANIPTDRSNIDEQAKVVFVFPGQGAQWLGMGRELLAQNPAFRESLTQCDKAIRKWADWSLLEQLMLDEDSPNYRLNEISVIQPTLFAMEVALAAVWRSWGIEPSAVIGHSMGEVAAAYVAGALSLEDAAHVICKRSQLMQRTSGMGAMVLIGLPLGESEELLKGYEDKLSIAVQNSPRSTVVSGDPDSLEALMENLRAQEIFCRHIKVDVASHSPQMDPIRPELVQALHGIKPRGATIPFYSTVTQDLCDGKSLDAEYWGRNLRQPVRFTGTIQRMLEDKHVIFIEMSPHPILLSSIEETCSAANTPSYRFASLRRDQPELKTILGELGSLYNAGYNVDWNKLYPHGEMVSLPAYPWQRERYWFETSAALKQTRPGAHPLLGQYMRSATGAHIWETTLNTKVFPYLSDHRVRGSVVFPAAAYVEMAFAAASEVYGSKPCLVTDFAFQEAFFLPAEEAQIIQLVMTSDTPDSAEFHFYSRAAQNDAVDSWSLHASGKIEISQETVSEETGSLKNLLSQQAETTGEEFYASVSMRGLEYGSNFQVIRSLAQQQHGILSKIKLPDELGAHMAKYRFHPVLIDACFQTLLFALPDSNQDTYLPTLLGKIRTHTPPNFGEEMWCYVIPNSEKDKTTGDILLFNTDGQLILSAQELQLQRLKARDEHIQDFLYEVKWQESPIPYRDQPAAKHWLIFADQQGTGRALAEHLQKDSQTSTIVSAGDTYQSINENAYQVDPLQPVHFQQLLKDISQPIHGIIHLWSLDCEPMPSTADPNLPGILHLVQAVAQSAVEETPRLWLVTRGTHSVNGKPEPISVSQAPVWGMGAVIANEFPNLNCARVDLSLTSREEEMELLARTLQADDGEDQVALRNRRRYVARLKHVQSSAENETKNSVKQTIEENQPFQVQ